MDALPIVFIHQGWFDHFHLAIQHARKFHPTQAIVHIGDHPYRHCRKLCDFESVNSHSGLHQTLSQHYQHISPNTIDFELFCIQRWYLLLSVMKKRNWNRCWVFDSDVLLFDRFDCLEQEECEHKITINQYSPHATLISDRMALEEFCRWTQDLYQNKSDQLRERSEDLGWGVQGISDMTLLTQFGREVIPVGDNSKPGQRGLIDNNIAMSQNLQMDGERKRIDTSSGVPYGYRQDNTRQKMRLLHFQGPAKNLMPAYAATDPQATREKFDGWLTRQRFSMHKRILRARRSLAKRLGCREKASVS